MTPCRPTFSDFEKIYASRDAQTLSVTLAGDMETPVSAYLKLSAALGRGFLLESVEGGAARGRYSILGFLPDMVFRADGSTCTLTRDDICKTVDLPLFDALRAFLKDSHITLEENLPAMAAGVFGVLGYNCVRDIEKIGAQKNYPFEIPNALFVRPTLVLIFDNVRDEMIFVTPVRYGDDDARTAYEAGRKRIDRAIAALGTPPPRQGAVVSSAMSQVTSNTSEADYLAMVASAKEFIAAGDAFQIVLSQRFETPFELPPFALYRALRRTNPSPYLFYFELDDFALIGSSPEICVQLKGDKVTLRPIAGTIRRGDTPQEDKANADKLLSDPKERAEHLMLLDLGRNDVGRVVKTGSVEVDEQFTIERYSEVMHIVSQVSGTLADGHDAIDVLKAAFPAGTVSGAPKIRAMQIINELERDGRGFYAGCVGYFSANGDMDTAIVLRTGLVRDGRLYVQAGAGIVVDSVAASEQNECVIKARALFRAAEVAKVEAAQA